MKLERLILSAAIVLFGIECISAAKEMTLALVLSVLVHELGHIFMIFALGLKIKNIRFELSGLCIDYAGLNTFLKELLVSLAGPISGIVFFVFAAYSENFSATALLELSAQLSLLYSVFNLLPVIPLDGGRILLCLSEKLLGGSSGEALYKKVSGFFCVILFVIGLICCLNGEGNGLFAASLWLILLQTAN